MTAKILIVYSTRTGINAQAADAIAETLKTTYSMDVTVADLRNGQPDITTFQNIIVGGGVKSTSVYNEAVDFLEKNFEGRNVAVYFCCEDEENPKVQSTEDNSKKVLAKNKSLNLVDVAAFGGCMLSQGRPVMDELNMNRVREWAIDLGKKFGTQSQPPQQGLENLNLLNTVPFENNFRFFTELGKNTGITARGTVEFAEKIQIVPIQSVTFHFQRQDFQKWFKNTVGDEELATRIDQVNLWTHDDENLRKALSKTVQDRITELTKSSRQISS
jgi:menaquinone-dependent protoporphyrinogen IX oxidase